MPGRKSTANVKPEAKAAGAMTEEVKAAPAAEVKDEEPKKTKARKTAVKKSVAEKKTTTKTTKASAKKAVEAAVVLQFDGKEYTNEDLVKIAKDVWKYDLKQKVGDFKKVKLFVKPEESKVYFVVKDEVTGEFGI